MAHWFMVMKRHESGGLLGSYGSFVFTLLMLLLLPVTHAETEIAEAQEQIDAIIRNEGNGLCLDGYGGADGALGDRPYFFHCNSDNVFQRWSWQWVLPPNSGHEPGMLYNYGNGLCLDGYGGADGALGDRPYFFHCNMDNTYQQWIVAFFVDFNSDGFLEVVYQNVGNGLCLDGYGGADGALGDIPYFYYCNMDNPYQYWREDDF